jgi:hypothetical protein
VTLEDGEMKTSTNAWTVKSIKKNLNEVALKTISIFGSTDVKKHSPPQT